MTIADRRADKTTDRVRTEQERKLTRLQRNKDKKRPKTDDNWVRNISSSPLDKTETHVLSYGLKHSVTPKRIPTESIVSSVEAVLSRQRQKLKSRSNRSSSIVAMVTIDDKLIVVFGRGQNLQSNHTQILLWCWIDFLYFSFKVYIVKILENWYHPP